MSFYAQLPILVTGGTGFIGSHLVEALLAHGAHVTLTIRNQSSLARHLAHVAHRLTVVEGDLQALLANGQLDLTHYAVIFHLSGNPYVITSVENPASDFASNLQTTFHLLETLRQQNGARLVYASTASVYGNPLVLPITEHSPTLPISPYGVSKLAAERYIEVYARLYGVRGASLRFFSVYGERQRKQVIFDILQKLQTNPHRLEIFGDGTQERDFCYIGDAVNALLLVGEHAPLQGEAYNVASGISHSINQVIALWCELLGVTPEWVYSGAVRAGEADKWRVDISALRALGYAPQTSLRDGLERVLQWYQTTPR